ISLCMLSETDLEVRLIQYQNKVFSRSVYFKCDLNNSESDQILNGSGMHELTSLDRIVQTLRNDGFLNPGLGLPYMFNGKVEGKEFNLTETLFTPKSETVKINIVYQVVGGKAYCMKRAVHFPGLGLTQHFNDVYDVVREDKHEESPIIREVLDLAKEMMKQNSSIEYTLPNKSIQKRTRSLLIVENGIASPTTEYFGIRLVMQGSITRPHKIKVDGKQSLAYRKYEVNMNGGFPLLHWHETYPIKQQPSNNFETFWVHCDADWIDGHARIVELSDCQYKKLLLVIPPSEEVIVAHLMARDNDFKSVVESNGAKEIIKLETTKKIRLDV
ncbi:MAG: hypothetical protein Q7R33_03815, partial [Nitrosarchaeum sp.]|nr:hypothetical protein [Nitrosarchaeum sp.]